MPYLGGSFILRKILGTKDYAPGVAETLSDKSSETGETGALSVIRYKLYVDDIYSYLIGKRHFAWQL
ncbi:MAG: hypothetical protein JSV47_04025, partial [Deltaproteobacteria bacterium]